MTKVIPIVAESRLPVEKSWDDVPDVVPCSDQEIVVSLFGECNLRCVFCYDAERFDERATVEGIKRRLVLVEEAIKHVNRPHLDVKVFGGELFQDKFGDEIWDAYERFFSALERLAKQYGKTLSIFVASNLNYWSCAPKVLELIRNHHIMIRGSFDFVGRFTKPEQVERFFKNGKELVVNGIPFELAFVATKPNITAIMNPETIEPKLLMVFDWFYYYSTVQFDFYNDVGVEGYTVTEHELFEFFKYLHQHLPKVLTVATRVANFKSGFVNYRYCNRGIWVDQIVQSACCDFKGQTTKFVENKGCLTCEHFPYCTGSCVRVFADDSECCIRLFFDWLANEKENNSNRE